MKLTTNLSDENVDLMELGEFEDGSPIAMKINECERRYVLLYIHEMKGLGRVSRIL